MINDWAKILDKKCQVDTFILDFEKANYTLEGTVLKNVESIKFLGVTITNDLKWNTHISNVCAKANRTLGFFRRSLY